MEVRLQPEDGLLTANQVQGECKISYWYILTSLLGFKKTDVVPVRYFK